MKKKSIFILLSTFLVTIIALNISLISSTNNGIINSIGLLPASASAQSENNLPDNQDGECKPCTGTDPSGNSHDGVEVECWNVYDFSSCTPSECGGGLC